MKYKLFKATHYLDGKAVAWEGKEDVYSLIATYGGFELKFDSSALHAFGVTIVLDSKYILKLPN